MIHQRHPADFANIPAANRVGPCAALRRALRLFCLFCALEFCVLPAKAFFWSATLRPQEPRCEGMADPQGIGSPQPRLSWQALPEGGAKPVPQSAFQVLVATSPDKLTPRRADLWNSGKVVSNVTMSVLYQGKPLTSELQCFWKVRVWDKNHRASGWSPTARWGMGLLAGADWKAGWIGAEGTEGRSPLSGAHWIWFPEGHAEKSAPLATRWFRGVFHLPADVQPESARCFITADNQYELFLNGEALGRGTNSQTASEFNALPLLRPGVNALTVAVTNSGDAPNPAGLLAFLGIGFAKASPLMLGTDTNWQSSSEVFTGWQAPDFDDSTWLPARDLGPAGMEPWGEILLPPTNRVSVLWLRKEFTITKPLRQAVVHFATPGTARVYLSGERVTEIHSPAPSGANAKTLARETLDVTRHLKPGTNVLGVLLCGGETPLPSMLSAALLAHAAPPKLRFQARLEYADHSIAVWGSDSTWTMTAEGPLWMNTFDASQVYDARRESPGWNRPGFTNAVWRPARAVEAPAEALSLGNSQSVSILATCRPVAITYPAPGVALFDFGQALRGTCRLHVSGPSGTRLFLRYGSSLTADGTLEPDKSASTVPTDTYFCKGQGVETYEPLLICRPFRYVQLRGLPKALQSASMEAIKLEECAPAATASN